MIQVIQAVLLSSGQAKVRQTAQSVTLPFGEPIDLQVKILADDGTTPLVNTGVVWLRVVSPQGGGVVYTLSDAANTRAEALIEVPFVRQLTPGTWHWDLSIVLPAETVKRSLVPLSAWNVLQSSIT